MRTISLDIGTVRTGFAFGDTDLGLALAGRDVILSSNLFQFLQREFFSNPYEVIIIGLPKNRDNQDTDMTRLVNDTILKLKEGFPHVKIIQINERLTTKIARENLGSGKYLDNEAARILLQEWLDKNYPQLY